MASGDRMMCWNKIFLLCSEELRLITNNFSLFGVPTAIRKRHLLNTSQKRYTYVTCSMADEMDWRVARMEETGNAFKILVKRSLNVETFNKSVGIGG